MSKISKIQNLITKYMKLQQQFDNLQHEIDNVAKWYEDEVLIYVADSYGEDVTVLEMQQCIQHINSLQQACTSNEDEADPVLGYEQLKIPHNVFSSVDISNLRIEISVEEEIDPYDRYPNPVTYVRFYGYVPWSEEQQEQQKKECKQKMAGIALDMHKVQEELLGLGVDILGE